MRIKKSEKIRVETPYVLITGITTIYEIETMICNPNKHKREKKKFYNPGK